MIERGHDVGLFQKRDGLRRHACGEKRNQGAGNAEQIARGNADQPEIGQKADQRPEHEAGKTTRHQGPAATALCGSDTVKKQHHFGAFTQHRDRDHDGERQERLRAGDHGFAGGAQFLGKLAAVSRHPDVMPGQHHHGETKNAGVENLLAGATE